MACKQIRSYLVTMSPICFLAIVLSADIFALRGNRIELSSTLFRRNITQPIFESGINKSPVKAKFLL